jgi:hypothetical protein
MSKWLITMATSEDECNQRGDVIFANFDLDADRGYFYRTWKGEISSDRVRVEECPY